MQAAVGRRGRERCPHSASANAVRDLKDLRLPSHSLGCPDQPTHNKRTPLAPHAATESIAGRPPRSALVLINLQPRTMLSGSDVAAHSSRESLWMIIHGKVRPSSSSHLLRTAVERELTTAPRNPRAHHSPPPAAGLRLDRVRPEPPRRRAHLAQVRRQGRDRGVRPDPSAWVRPTLPLERPRPTLGRTGRFHVAVPAAS